MCRDYSALDSKRAQVERAIGMPIVIRGIRTPDPTLRGRVRLRPGYLLLEYQVAIAGYFWHVPIIEELLYRIERGEREIVMRQHSTG